MQKYFAVFLLSFALASPALACSPSRDMARPIAERMAAAQFFVGKVKAFTEKDVTFNIITPGGPANDAKVGDEITLSRGDYGTCGRFNFALDEIWLYDGSDISFSPSQRLQPSDMFSGMDVASIERAVIGRLDPDYVPPHVPTKADMPVPGTYSATQQCESQNEFTPEYRHYILNISPPDSKGEYNVDVKIKGCKAAEECHFAQSAPPYGYGEIVLPLEGSCSLIVQQISPPSEWPRLAKGETKLQLNNPQCAIPTCRAINYMPVLKWDEGAQ